MESNFSIFLKRQKYESNFYPFVINNASLLLLIILKPIFYFNFGSKEFLIRQKYFHFLPTFGFCLIVYLKLLRSLKFNIIVRKITLTRLKLYNFYRIRKTLSTYVNNFFLCFHSTDFPCSFIFVKRIGRAIYFKWLLRTQGNS